MPEEGTIEPSLVVTPTTEEQVIYAPEGVEGYEVVTALGVTSAIDANITSGNIKQGVTILGTEGELVVVNGEEVTRELTTQGEVTITPSSGKNGITRVTAIPKNYNRTGANAVTPATSDVTLNVPSGYSGNGTTTVKAVTSAIDSNIQAGNIKQGISILGIEGNVVGLNGETRSVSLSSTGASVFTPTSGKNGMTQVTVNANNYNWTGANAITPTLSQQVVNIPSGYSGNGNITVNAVTSAIDSNIQAGNIKKNVNILGVTGSLEVAETIITSIYDNYIVRTNGDIELLTKGSYTLGAQSTTLNSSLKQAYSENTTVKKVVLGKLQSIEHSNWFEETFRKSTYLEEVDLTGIINISTSDATTFAFTQCPILKKANLSNLATISGQHSFYGIFQSCKQLVDVDLSNLVSISGESAAFGAFAVCTSLKTLSFDKLSSIADTRIFQQCFVFSTSLASLYFPALNSASFGSYTNQFDNMLRSVTGCTVHFPSNLQSVIGSWSDVVAGFGGTNTVVLFDLPSTEVVSNTHTLTVQINDDYCNYLSLNGTEVSHGRGNYTYTYPSGTTVAVRYDITGQSNVTTSYVMDQDRTLSIGSSTWVIN